MTPKSNLCIDLPDYEPTSRAIMNLFVSDEVALRAADIIRRTGRGEDSVRKALTRLTRDGDLFRVGLCQYARVATAKPIRWTHTERITTLERQIAELKSSLARVADSIDRRAAQVDGPAHAAMTQIAASIREVSR